MTTANSAKKIPRSIYLHWPWCVKKCPYCDFNSHRLPAEDRRHWEAHYVEAMCRDLAAWRSHMDEAGVEPIASIFIGGGTPSLMSPESLERLLEAADSLYPLAEDCEITLEANPGTIDESRFAAFKLAGINRLSLGIQSFNDAALARLGRIHNAADAARAAQAAGQIFENFNLDLMFGLPGEGMAEWSHSLSRAIDAGATHLSCYQLTIEPGTAFAKRVPEGLPDDELLADMGDFTAQALAQAGFEHYEISGYAKPGRKCRHNLNYWTFGDYLAAGAGAHGKLTTAQGIVREMRWASPAKYLNAVEHAGNGAEETHLVEKSALPFEFMLNALRLTDGVPASFFTERTGLPIAVIEPTLETLRQQELLVADKTRIQATEKGLLFLSDLQEAFL